jgi:tight adherence protein C
MAVAVVVGIAFIFVAMFLGLASFGGLAKESTGINRSISVIEALTQAPEEMKAELDAPFTDRVLFPLLARVQGIGRRLTPADSNDRIRAKLDRAGNPPGWTVERISAGKVVGFAAAVVIALLLSLALGLSFFVTLGFVVVAGVVGYLAPDFYLYQKAYDRADKLQRALPDAIDLLIISVVWVLGFVAAVQLVARNTVGPLADVFSRLLQ